MLTETAQSRSRDPIVQFSVFTPNRLGRLRDLMSVLGGQNVHVLALAILDTTDSAIIRIVLDDPDRARGLLVEQGFPFSESEMVVVEINSALEMHKLTTALLEAELNINYLYSFIPYPDGKPVLCLSMEDNEMAEQVLMSHRFRILRQADIAR